MDSKRLQPANPLPSPVSTPLSILDATVGRYSPTGAIWVFGRSPVYDNDAHFAGILEETFTKALDDFPFWAGQLQWAPMKENGSHTERFNRPLVVYGSKEDPGVEWNVVRLDRPVESLIPDQQTRASDPTWIMSFTDSELMASETPIALHDLGECRGLPSMVVQITLFKDGGYAVAIKLSHILGGDAHSLMLFMHRWESVCRSEMSSQSPADDLLVPVFDPAMFDSRAAGDIDAIDSNPDLVSVARSLPLLRHDWWETITRNPLSVSVSTVNSKPKDEKLLQKAISGPVDPIPWDSWDFSKPSTRALLHFSESDLLRLKLLAAESGGNVSRLDALLAHVWAAINRARSESLQNNDKVHLDVTIGVRERVSPPLPSGFVGNAILLPNCTVSYSDFAGLGIKTGPIAQQIRQCIGRFTPEAVAAVLHEAAHDVAPQRLWRAWLGSKHTLVTSWARLGVYGIDFVGDGSRPCYVQPIMPSLDGLLCVMDTDQSDGGLDILLALESEAMKRLLADTGLRARDSS